MSRRPDPKRIEVVDDKVAEILRGKTPAERGEMIAGMWRTARSIVEGGVRSQHPQWGPEEVKAEVRRRLTGDGTERRPAPRH